MVSLAILLYLPPAAAGRCFNLVSPFRYFRGGLNRVKRPLAR
jgi:hypothetical protein